METKEEFQTAIQSLSEKIDQRFDELIRQIKTMQEDNDVRIEDSYLLAIASFVFKVIIAAVILWGGYKMIPIAANYLKSDGNTASSSLILDQAEMNLLQSATELIANDMTAYDSIGTALSALYAELPTSIRDQVVERLGAVKDTTELPIAMQDLIARTVVRNDKPTEAIVLRETEIIPTEIKQDVATVSTTHKQNSRRRLIRRR